MGGGCVVKGATSGFFYIGHNKVFVPGGKPKNRLCGYAKAKDVGTTISDSAGLTTDEIVKMGQAVLVAPNGPAVPPHIKAQ